MIFDTHAHYDDEKFDEDREELLQSMKQAGIGTIVNVGASLDSTRRALELSHKYDFIYAAVGVHPSDTEQLNEDNFEMLREWSEDGRCVAIGEIGLDYYWPEPGRDLQKKWFVRQLELARDQRLPVIIHSRDAAEDTLRIMKENHAEEIGGVVHCFSYPVEIAKICLDMGFYIGVGGVITFKNGRKLREVVEMTPMEKILLETDCPYLAPEPYRGKRNNSQYLPYVVKEIAQIKGMTEDEVISITEENARRMYGI